MSVERSPEKFIRSFLILAAVFSTCKTRPEKNFPNSKVTPISKLSLDSFKPETTSAASPVPIEHIASPTLKTKEEYLTPENIIFPTATIPTPSPELTSTPTPLPTFAPEIIESEIILSLWEEKMYQAIQELRKQENLPTLKLSNPLIEVARERSLDMATRDYFSHMTPEDIMVFELLEQKGILCVEKYTPGGYGCGELLFRTDYDESHIDEAIEAIIDKFLNSPDHQLILLRNEYQFIGIGVATSEDNLKYSSIIFSFPVK